MCELDPAAGATARCLTSMSGNLEDVPPRSDWIVAICSVLFDLDVGQRIDSIVPEGALTDEEANDVAFHSFPVCAAAIACGPDASPQRWRRAVRLHRYGHRFFLIRDIVL